MNGQGPGIWLHDRDQNGLVSGVRILVVPCVNEPNDTNDVTVRWSHGLACYAFDDGTLFMCGTCGRERRAEEARQERLRRLAPIHRQWLAARGICDWPLKVGAS